MEEEGGVKVPVTRSLRRRLSVEQTDDTRSPSASAPSTPTKKRGGRLAAKPQLELIDEHAVQNSPKKAPRKSIARDLVEQEEKPVTPARRSTRVKSNTSLVSESDDKVLTPARRSTRIKSNTSIVAEATQSVESPRAKRAVTRRNSQVGSDTEAPVTPARTRRTRKGSTSSIDREATPSVSETAVTPGRTRRTRKGSISSIDTPAEAAASDKPSLITEVISEEPESNGRKSVTTAETEAAETEDSPTRKSPRLKAKKDRKSISKDVHEDESQDQADNAPTQDSSQDSKMDTESQNDVLSISSVHLINGMDEKPKKKKSDKNKSTSNIDDNSSILDKRSRTKSLTHLSVTSANEGNFYSDNESTKKKLKKHEKSFNNKRLSDNRSGDGQSEISIEQDEQKNTSKSNRKSNNNSFASKDYANKSITDADKAATTDDANVSNESNKENLPNEVKLMFEKAPSNEMQAVVFMEDSDSNTETVLNSQNHKTQLSETEDTKLENGKQTPDAEFNDSCEPMDIDETMPDHVSLTDFKDVSVNSIGKKSRKSSLRIQDAENSFKDTQNKSNRKSSITQNLDNSVQETANISLQSQPKDVEYARIEETKSRKSLLNDSNVAKETLDKSKRKSNRNSSISQKETANISILPETKDLGEYAHNHGKKSRKSSQNDSNVSKGTLDKSKRKSLLSQSTEEFEKSANDNKSTLVLSQIKDISTTENSVSKSPRMSNELTGQEDITDGPVNKALMLNYQTSTPVQQKNTDKLMQMNTSVITPEKAKKNTSKTNLKKNISTTSKSTASDSSEGESSESEDESSQNNSNFLEEAEDAGDDYESGDSEDEEERQYEEENEIVERGETLTSEGDVSNDSDYEKDSFIVSSDEEDNDLLSGSGDDLDMSDNELTMSAKSKKKYNERKIKEQKKASKEMFEARHKLNEVDEIDSKKKNRLRLDSSLLEISEDNMVPPKKNKRMRLESSQTASEVEDVKSVTNTSQLEEIGYKKKKSKRLSESFYNESVNNEKEITISNENVTGKEDPLSLKVKPEPKTPQKDLNISTVHFTDREEMEQVEINDNVSIIKPNDTVDPLHATMAQEEDSDDSDDASISENEEIAKNYDSILNELNKENKKLIKTRDISLNLYKKSKQVKEALLDELNLTQTKDRKKSKDFLSQSNTNAEKRVSKKFDAEDSASSDSIDLKLLFSDDSNGSHKKDNHADANAEAAEKIIPLKRTPGKTNIRNVLEDNEEPLGFFIDTKGDLPEEPSKNTSLNTSTKKKHKKDAETDTVITNGYDSDDAPTEIFYQSNKNHTKTSTEIVEDNEKVLNVSKSNQNKTPGSERKKKKLLDAQIDDTALLNGQMLKTPTSEKKNKAKSSETDRENEVTVQDQPVPTSDKKKKRISASHENNSPLSSEKPKAITPVSEKKKKKVSESSEDKICEDKVTSVDKEEHIMNTEGVSGKKRKRKSSHNTEEALPEGTKDLNTSQKPIDQDVGSKKKKRKTKNPTSNVVQSEEPPVKANNKRKDRDDDEGDKKSKIFKENSFDKIHVPRLPSNIINELEDKPRKEILETRKAVATSDFLVEETRRRKNKPSEYLEESVYLNDDDNAPVSKKKYNLKKPKVLPFLPTVSISDSGFTTNFQVHVMSQKMEFVAQKSDLPNFKNDHLNEMRVKKLRTYDKYKRHRNMKMSKF